MTTNDSVITLRGVSFSYGGPTVLKDVTLDIHERDLVCVIGPNGGGKTTLIKLMLGLIEPDEGHIDVLGTSPGSAHTDIGYLPQSARYDLQFPVNAMDVVLMGRLGKRGPIGPYSRSDKAVAMRVLEEVGLAGAARRPLASLSGGQRQRVLIARALACEPRILLLDEPTANLDPAVQDDLYDLLRELNRRLTVVIVSHDIGFVSLFFKTVVCVNCTVHVHPTEDLTERTVADMYGREVRLVHHALPANHRVKS